jgi:hypothetical protein
VSDFVWSSREGLTGLLPLNALLPGKALLPLNALLANRGKLAAGGFERAIRLETRKDDVAVKFREGFTVTVKTPDAMW